MFSQPCPQSCDHILSQRGETFFASLPAASNRAAGTERDIFAAKAGELRDPQAGLSGEKQEGVIPAACRSGSIRSSEQRLHFRPG